MVDNRCMICGKKLHDPYALYCSECEYELKRARLADEETVEEWLERMREERIMPVPEYISPGERENIKTLDEWF